MVKGVQFELAILGDKFLQKSDENSEKELTRRAVCDMIINVIWLWSYDSICGGCGEAANTADCGSVMRGFEPHHSPHFFYLISGLA